MHGGDERAGVLAWGRALVLASVALLTGAVAHVCAGGLLPGGAVLLAGTLLTAVACRPWLTRPASTRRIVALTVIGQSAIHLGLSLTAGHRSAAGHRPDGGGPAAPHGGPGGGPGGGHGAHGAHAGHGAPGTYEAHGAGTGGDGGLAHLLTDLTGPDAPMVLLHLVAAAAVGLWLARGERALWMLLRTVWRRIAPPLPTTGPPITTRGPTHVPRSPASTPLRDLAPIVTRRGPPALLAT